MNDSEIKCRAPEKLTKRLRDVSRKTGIPQSTIIRRGVEHSVAKLEKKESTENDEVPK